MQANTLSPAFTTDKIDETRDFYVRHLGAKVTFDCGWYVNLEFGKNSSSLQFMSPQLPEHQLATGAGLIYNFAVEDVDNEYKKLTEAGLTIIVPLADHPWGIEVSPCKIPMGLLCISTLNVSPGKILSNIFSKR